jgi:hypothetical protein
LEILPDLAALARRRLPHWADCIVVGNALEWTPEHPFDFVRVGLEYVPAPLQARLIAHLLKADVAPGGRLIVGAQSEPVDSPPHLRAEVANWGFAVAGAAEVPHSKDDRVVRRAFWLEKPL